MPEIYIENDNEQNDDGYIDQTDLYLEPSINGTITKNDGYEVVPKLKPVNYEIPNSVSKPEYDLSTGNNLPEYTLASTDNEPEYTMATTNNQTEYDIDTKYNTRQNTKKQQIIYDTATNEDLYDERTLNNDDSFKLRHRFSQNIKYD